MEKTIFKPSVFYLLSQLLVAAISDWEQLSLHVE